MTTMMSMSDRKKIYYTKGIIIFILLSFFPVPFLLRNDFLSDVFFVWRIAAALLIVIILLLNEIRITKITFLILMFYFVLIIPTYINGGDLLGLIVESIFVFLFCMFVDQCIYQNRSKPFFEAIIIITEVLAYINLFSVVFFPEGLYFAYGDTNHYLLGNSNTFIRQLLPGVCIALIYSHMNYRKINLRTQLLLMSVFVSLLLTWSVTGIVAYLILFLYVLFLYKLKIPKWLNIKFFFLIYIILFLSIVVFRVHDIFAYIITNLMDKDLTLTGRTLIWDRAINYIEMAPIMGHGYEYENIFLSKMRTVSAHNYVYDLLYRGGIVHLLIHFLILFSLVINLNKFKNDKIAQILSFTLFSYFIMWLTEPFVNSGYLWMFLIFILAYRISDIRIKQTN